MKRIVHLIVAALYLSLIAAGLSTAQINFFTKEDGWHIERSGTSAELWVDIGKWSPGIEIILMKGIDTLTVITDDSSFVRFSNDQCILDSSAVKFTMARGQEVGLWKLVIDPTNLIPETNESDNVLIFKVFPEALKIINPKWNSKINNSKVKISWKVDTTQSLSEYCIRLGDNKQFIGYTRSTEFEMDFTVGHHKVWVEALIYPARLSWTDFVEFDVLPEFNIHNYPNPFNPTTTISYDLPAKSHVRLTVFNAAGQIVTTLVDAEQEAGSYHARWDGSAVPSGVYFYRLEGESFTKTMKMTMMR